MRITDPQTAEGSRAAEPAICVLAWLWCPSQLKMAAQWEAGLDRSGDGTGYLPCDFALGLVSGPQDAAPSAPVLFLLCG